MELIDIIQSSVTIFGGALFIIGATSFIIFKIKDKSRVKPYSNIEIAKDNNKIVAKPARPIQTNKVVNNTHKRVVNQTPIFYIPENQKMQSNVLDYYDKNKSQNMHKVRFSVQNANLFL
ncbi:MAG: hypothetical protein Q8903_10980 [Bacteroidota bacterium]|nr:hypothetical protein [Bacteroidota bacterium]